MSFSRAAIAVGAAIFIWLWSSVVALAHQPGLSTLFVDVGSNRVNAQLIVAWHELDASAPLDTNRDRTLSAEELAAARPRLLRLGESALAFESDGRMLSLKAPPDIQIDDTTGIRFQLTFELPATQVLLVTSEIVGELQPGHSQIVMVRDARGAKIGETVLDRNKPTVEIPLIVSASGKQPTSATREFLLLGLEHIVTGWDHLAFLFGLLIVGGKLRDAVKIITSFTLAHSLTLALATFNLIRIPSSIVEPIIAASIIYVGFENILRRDFQKRWMLTFAFGLIHGCGFASILREMGVGTNGSSVVTPLVWFNVGVELGQLAIAALVLPLIWKLKNSFPKRWVPVTSVALIILGSYFLMQRVWPLMA
jgi:hydrogenase/urease accessory protein HupE